MTKNQILPSFNYCQQKGKKSVLEGQISWINVFREEVEVIKNQDLLPCFVAGDLLKMVMKFNDKMLWIIIFPFVIDIKCVNANNCSYDQAYHTVKKTWKAASDECGSFGLEFEENVLKNIDALLGKEFWIGMAIYSVTTPWIEILGCFAVPDGHGVKKSPSIVLCQKQCESYQFFAYRESTAMCSCLHNKSSSYSIKNCIEQKNSTYFFVYKVFSWNISGNDNNGKCTTLYCVDGNNRLTAANCNDDNIGTSSTCNNGSIVGWGITYSTSKHRCLSSYQLLLPPETYCQLMGHENEARLSWTNVFRAETEAKLTQAEASTKEPLYCLAGSFTENNDKRELSITRRVCNDQLQFTCRIGTASSTTPSQRLIAVGKPEKGSSTSFHTDEASATTQSQSTVVTMKLKKYSSTNFDIGAVIGGILGAFAMVAVLAVVIVRKLRSKGIFTESNTHDYDDTSRVTFSKTTYEDLEKTNHKSLTATTNQTCDVDESSAPIYEEVQK